MKANSNYDISVEITTKMIKGFSVECDEYGKVTNLLVWIDLPKNMKIKSSTDVCINTFKQAVRKDGWILFTITKEECYALEEYCLSNEYFKYGSNWYKLGAIYD